MGPHQYSDVARFMLVDRHARELCRTADDVLGYRLTDRYRDSDDPYSEYAQVAFLVNCLALARLAEEQHGVDPIACTGASFGEKTVAAYTGALTVADAIDMTARTARCVAEYFRTAHQDVVTHSFLRTPKARLAELLAELDGRGEWYEVSCELDEDFHMVSLREPAVAEFSRAIRAGSGMSLYTMRPPMHAAAFAGLRERIEEEVIGGLEFADPRVPVVSDQDGSPLTGGEEIRTLLLDGFVRALRWPSAVDGLAALGVGKVCVAGPDSLFGRVGTTTRRFEVLAMTPQAALRPRAAARVPAG
ncbi:ACP S-malonyltransferase [Streptomyces sp. ventii]|uniref:[acyl-carrier-protein] S-malonyltransferase n=2 Tax=Streptomyces spiramenti TaxID=2720606 RepID=A0ABX1AKG5_9ACTN|nr:ACP S-malonyltransferase [Streptomyces spiramenti]